MHFLYALTLLASTIPSLSFARHNQNNGGGGHGGRSHNNGGGHGGRNGGGGSGGGSFSAETMLCLVNAQRAKNGARPLGLSQELMDSASQQSQFMSQTHMMSHTGRDGSTPEDRIQDAGFDWIDAGENVAFGQPSMQAVMTAWMKSPGHRANILNPKFTMFGAAVAGSGTKYWTQDFGNDGSSASNIPNCGGVNIDIGGDDDGGDDEEGGGRHGRGGGRMHGGGRGGGRRGHGGRHGGD